nr:hypothetical protein [Tanacetum cinerariifolium]
MHTSKDDYLISTLKFVSATESTQIYGAILPECLTTPAMKESKAYKTYHGYATGAVPSKIARNFKKSSPSKKDSDLVRVNKEPVTKGKRIKRSVKKSSTKPATCIVIREPPVETKSKRKEKVDVTHGKRIKLISEVALTEEAQMKEVRKNSLRDFHKLHHSGSVTATEKPPRVDKITLPVTSERTGDKPGVPDVTKDESTESKDEKNKSDDDKTPSNSEKGLDSEQDSDGSESDFESDQQEYDDDEVKDDNENDDDDKFKGDEDRGMNSDDVQDKKTDVEMTDAQQEKENLKITQEQVVEDAYVTITTVAKETKVPDASGSHSSDLASKFLKILDDPPNDAEIVSPLDVHVHHEVLRIHTSTLLTVPVSVIPEASPACTTIPQSSQTFTSPPLETTPTPPPTIKTTNIPPLILDFALVFRFNNRVIALEKDVAELKKDPLHTQVTALVDDHLDTRMGATREEFMNFLSASLTDRITKQVRNQLPQILPKEVSNFAWPVIETMITESLNQRSQQDKDKDEGPSAGSNQRLKKGKTSKDAEPTTSPKNKYSLSRSSKGTKSQPKSSGKSVHAEEPEFEVGNTNTPQGQEGNQGNDDVEPKKESASRRDWFTKPSRPQEPTDPDWNKDKTPQKGPTQNWLMTPAASTSTDKSLKEFDELMSTPIDFLFIFLIMRNGGQFEYWKVGLVLWKEDYKFIDLQLIMCGDMFKEVLSQGEALKIVSLLEIGPAFRLLKGTCSNYAELEYDFEEFYKALLEKLDWDNPKGGDYPFHLSKPLPLITRRNRQSVPVEFFINNYLKYLQGGISTMTYTASTTKIKAAQYDLPGIEDIAQRKSFCAYARGKQSRGDVYSIKRILAITHVSVMRKHGYGYLEEIVVRRAGNALYKFKEGDFLRLWINDIEDMLLLVVQNQLTNLSRDDVADFAIALRMFTRSLVIQKRVEDLQLGVESYQKLINVTKPDTTRPDLRKRHPYTPYKDPQVFIYVDDYQRNKLMRSDELYKFDDGTLTMLLSSLKDITKNIDIEYLPKRRWSKLEKKRAHFMIKDINKLLKERRMMRSLDKFVGGRLYGTDLRLLQRTISYCVHISKVTLKMIPEPGDANRDITVTETFHLQTDDKLSDKELKQIEADDQAIQTILLGLPKDIYAAIDSYETTQEIWLRPEWSRHVTIVHQTKDLHTTDYTQLYDFLKYNQKEVDELKAEQLIKTQDPLALMANSNNPYVFPTPHQDQSSFNQNYLQQPMTNPEDITDPTTAMNMALALIAKAFKRNYSTPTNNNQRISSNPKNRQIAQPRMNMGQERQMQIVGGNGGNQFRQYAGNLDGYNNIIRNQIRNGNLMAARAEGNAAGQNGNQIRCYNCRGVGHYARNCTVRLRRRDAAYLQTQLLIAQKEEAGIQLQEKEYDLMAATADLDEIEEVNANCILMANLEQASTLSTQTDSAPVYDTDGSAEVHENYDDNEIFNMFTQEEQYTELLEPIPESHQVPQNDNDVISEDTSVEQGGETVEQHPANFEETQETLQLAQESRDKMKQLNKEIKPANYTKINHLSGVFVPQKALSRKELFFLNNSKTANVSKSFLIPNADLSDDTTPSVACKFLNEVKSTILTLQRVIKQRMTIETHNWASSAH